MKKGPLSKNEKEIKEYFKENFNNMVDYLIYLLEYQEKVKIEYKIIEK